MNRARIYKPLKNAMQSGIANQGCWILEYIPAEAKLPDPIMGWVGSSDTKSQIKMKFKSLEDAEGYAIRKGIEFQVLQHKVPKKHIKSYAENFK